MYADVNQMLGDIVKVTPTSKAVGDFALFLIANDLTISDVLEGRRELAYPQSVIDLVGGAMGQPMGGFPAKVKSRILSGQEAQRARAASRLPAADFDATASELERTFLKRQPTRREVVSYLLYPAVFHEFAEHQQRYVDTSVLPSPAFFYGLQSGEEIAADIERGKTLIIKLMTVGEPHADGRRTVFFELNGQPRAVTVVDHSLEQKDAAGVKADPADPNQVAAPMPGMVVTVAVREGDSVAKDQKLLTLEAMKMQTTLTADRDGRIGRMLVKPGASVETGDLLLVVE
jgi:pyruvate carboxylase